MQIGSHNTVKDLVSLAKWLSVHLQTKWVVGSDPNEVTVLRYFSKNYE